MLGNKSVEELQELFDILDVKLHKDQTYDQMEDRMLSQEIDIENLNYTINMMKGNPQNWHEGRF
jgi:hypothetical protein